MNADQQFTIVASELDPTSDRIVEFLAESYGVPVNAVFFRHFSDDGRDYLARTWLLDPQPTEDKAARLSPRPSRSKSRPWNGQDFYIVLGRASDTRRWSVASKYGMLNAGNGSWYWKPLRNLTPKKRVFAYVAGAGYVGIGRVTGEMIPARDATVDIDGQSQPLLDQPELSTEKWANAASEDPEETEMVVPVEWLAIRDPDQAVREKGLFTSRATVCKLRDEHTIKTVEQAMGLATGRD